MNRIKTGFVLQDAIVATVILSLNAVVILSVSFQVMSNYRQSNIDLSVLKLEQSCVESIYKNSSSTAEPIRVDQGVYRCEAQPSFNRFERGGVIKWSYAIIKENKSLQTSQMIVVISN